MTAAEAERVRPGEDLLKSAPKGAADLWRHLNAAGWRVQLRTGPRSGGETWWAVAAVDPKEPVKAVYAQWYPKSWGQRPTMRSCMIRRLSGGWRDVSARVARQFVASPAEVSR